MKRLALLTVLAIGFSLSSHAQNFHFGAKVGLNFADITGDIDFDGRTSFHIGAVAELGVADKFAIQPELIYSSQGADLGSFDTNIDYLNLPILGEYKVSENLSLQLGPQFGINVAEGDDVDDVESFDLSGAAGVEVSFSKFFAQARYNFGLTDVVDGFDSKNSVFQISVGYWFL